MTTTTSDVAQGLRNRQRRSCSDRTCCRYGTRGQISGISGQDGETVRIAPAIGELIIELLGHISADNMITPVPVSATPTTWQAVDMLNASRPHLTKLL